MFKNKKILPVAIAVIVILAAVAAIAVSMALANRDTENVKITMADTGEDGESVYASDGNVLYLGYLPSDYVSVKDATAEFSKGKTELSEEEKKNAVQDFLNTNDIDDITDDTAAGLGYGSAEELEDSIYQNYISWYNETFTEPDNAQAMIDAVKEGSEFTGYPDVLQDIITQRLECMYQRNYGSSMLEVLGTEEEVDSHVESYMQYELVYEAVSEKYGITVSQDEVDEYKADRVANGEYADEEELSVTYTQDYTDIVIAQNLLSKKVRNYLTENCLS